MIREEKTPAPERTRKKKVEQTLFEFAEPKGDYMLPPLTLLDDVPRRDTKQRRENLIANARLLEKKLADFGVEGKVTEVKPGPVITMYELEPAPGVKINKISNLSDDLALALKAPSVRIVAPIPGKAAIGIEIPNPERDAVYLRDAIDNEAFAQAKHRLPIALGEDITGMPVIADLVRMPHLLIAGTTGSGKSVFLNALICSLLFKAPPDEVKFLHDRPQAPRACSLRGAPAPDAPRRGGRQGGRPGAALGRRGDGEPLPHHRRDGREEHRQVQPLRGEEAAGPRADHRGGAGAAAHGR